MINERIKIVVPGDDPPQIQDSPHLERLKDYGDLTLYTDRPKDRAEKIARVAGAEVIMNTRSAVTWGEEEFAQLPDLKMITTCSIGTDNFDLAAAKKHRIVISNQTWQDSTCCRRTHIRHDVCRGEACGILHCRHETRSMDTHG